MFYSYTESSEKRYNNHNPFTGCSALTNVTWDGVASYEKPTHTYTDYPGTATVPENDGVQNGLVIDLSVSDALDYESTMKLLNNLTDRTGMEDYTTYLVKIIFSDGLEDKYTEALQWTKFKKACYDASKLGYDVFIGSNEIDTDPTTTSEEDS